MTNKSLYEKALPFIAVISALLLFYLVSKHRQKIFDNPEYTICEVVERYSGATYIIEYYIDGIRITEPVKVGLNLVKGEKFKIIYNKNNPINPIILYEEPIFTDDEETGTCTGKILKKNKFSKKIKIEYEIGGVTYIKFFYVNSNVMEDIEVGMKCNIEYWKKDYRRVVISYFIYD